MPAFGSGFEAAGLKLRLQSCLQTILELRSELDSMPFGLAFMPEIGSLEEFLSQLEHLQINEPEVLRIEQATAKFLSELKELMEHVRAEEPDKGGLLQ